MKEISASEKFTKWSVLFVFSQIWKLCAFASQWLEFQVKFASANRCDVLKTSRSWSVDKHLRVVKLAWWKHHHTVFLSYVIWVILYMYHMMCFDQWEHTNYLLGYEIWIIAWQDMMTWHGIACMVWHDMAWHGITSPENMAWHCVVA